MAADIFVEIKGLTGDATEKEHKGWFVIDSLGWGMERSVDTDDLGSQQRGYGNAKFNKVELQSEFGTGSLLLAQAAATGTNYKDIEIHLCRAKGDGTSGQQVYLKYFLKNAMIYKYELSADSGTVPKETWSLAYRELGISYESVDDANKKQTPEKFGWDTIEQIYKAVA